MKQTETKRHTQWNRQKHDTFQVKHSTYSRVDKTQKNNCSYDNPNRLNCALLKALSYHLVEAVAHTTQLRWKSTKPYQRQKMQHRTQTPDRRQHLIIQPLKTKQHNYVTSRNSSDYMKTAHNYKYRHTTNHKRSVRTVSAVTLKPRSHVVQLDLVP